MKKPLKRRKQNKPARIALLVATGNAHKLREIRKILGARYRCFGQDILAAAPRVKETGKTFRANAKLKALGFRAAWLRADDAPRVDWILADDSGLVVRALRGAPGVRSARYAGRGATDEKNRAKLLREMRKRRDRRARFECVLALLAARGGRVHFFRGVAEGDLALKEKGSGGFGYDPLFMPRGTSRTFAEMSALAKNRLSHRGAALRELARWSESTRIAR